MKNTFRLLVLFALISSTALSAQSEETGNMLRGTTVLEGSNRNMTSMFVHGFRLAKLTASDCLSTMEEAPKPTEITSISFDNDSSLVIEFTTEANCAHDFLGEIEVVEDSILNLVYHGYGGYAICACCFGLRYEIELMSGEYADEPFFFDKIKYVQINGMKEVRRKLDWGNRKGRN